MTPVRLEPVALRSQVKHSTTEPLCSLLGVGSLFCCVAFCTLSCPGRDSWLLYFVLWLSVLCISFYLFLTVPLDGLQFVIVGFLVTLIYFLLIIYFLFLKSDNVGTQKNLLSETVLLSKQNICFD